MIHNEKIQRGAIDKSFIAIKCTFHKEMTHSEVLTKCIEYVWEGKMGTYYLGDGSGCKIPDKDLTIRIKEKETSDFRLPLCRVEVGDPSRPPYLLVHRTNPRRRALAIRMRYMCTHMHALIMHIGFLACFHAISLERSHFSEIASFFLLL